MQTIDQLEREIGRRELAEKALRERTKKLEGLNVELERRTRQLRALAVELSQMEDSERHRLADMLHDDLQQILVGIRYQLDLIRWRIGEDRQTTEIVDQIGELVSQAIGRSRSLSHELSPPMLRQKGLLSAIKWLSDYMKDQHGLAVELVLSKDAEPASELLRSFLYKAARELLFNVVKHAGVQEARLELQRAGRSLRLTVRDEGMGFDPESLLSGAGEEGTGLLNIQERLELMGGHLDVDSKPGAGSTFEITLLDEPGPRGDMAEDTMVQMGTADRNRLRASQRLSMRAGRTPLRVLLADDHRIMREGLASLLAEEGDLEIVGQVDNGEQAIEQARKLRPDVIVMDISMPVMDGIEATRIIKGESPGIRIVGLSMYEQADLTQDMLEAGAEVQLSKAGPSAELLRAIRGSHS